MTQYDPIVRPRFVSLFLVLCSMLPARAAWAWWEATLQQVDIALTLDEMGNARVVYDLRHHVDRGRFEGINIMNPGRTIEWDRLASYIEDSHGRRYPVSIVRRGRDGAYLVRLANTPGLRRGWVSVHLEYPDDLMDCCLRLDADERPQLRWTALSWDVGMDRMSITLNLAGTDEAPEPDEETRGELSIEPLEGGGLYIERIRPVRWYELRLGMELPREWLRRRPQMMVEALPAQLPTAEEASPEQLAASEGERLDREIGYVVFGLFALSCLFLLAFKTWITATGYDGRVGVAPMLILNKVPSILRWLLAFAALSAGAWLQSISYVAGGTLSVAFGVLLTLRAPVRARPLRRLVSWRAEPLDSLAELVKVSVPVPRRRHWAPVVDGTTPIGFLTAVATAAGGGALVSWLITTEWAVQVEAVVIDLGLAWTALFWTGRRRDLVPCVARAAAPSLTKVSRLIAPSAERWRSAVHAQYGSPADGGEPDEVRLTLSPPPAGTKAVVVRKEPRLRLGGWSSVLVASIEGTEGATTSVAARGPRTLTRRLRRRVGKTARAAASS